MRTFRVLCAGVGEEGEEGRLRPELARDEAGEGVDDEGLADTLPDDGLGVEGLSLSSWTMRALVDGLTGVFRAGMLVFKVGIVQQVGGMIERRDRQNHKCQANCPRCTREASCSDISAGQPCPPADIRPSLPTQRVIRFRLIDRQHTRAGLSGLIRSDPQRTLSSLQRLLLASTLVNPETCLR